MIANYDESMWVRFCSLLIEKIYCFKAERFNIGKSRFGNKTILENDASNLPEVLNKLQSNPTKFLRYNDCLKTVFPEINQVSVRPYQSDHLEILAWTINPKTEREDLAIPLSESGTGLGQVLAILYVVLEKEPQIIIIDELQSFLHPGASNKLIEILKQNSHHQYIIATHSSTVISATDPETITLIQHEESESILVPLDKNDAKDIQFFLSEIGVRLSDIFGADNILWVEGATEEKCFSLIVEKILKIPLMGTSIIGVVSTGDIEGQHQKTIFRIYSRLSKATALSPAALGFIFDRETKDETDIADLERQSSGLVKFLPKRMYENYLLNCKAIAFVINGIEGFSSEYITEKVAHDWIEKNRSEQKYWKPFKPENGDTKIQAAKLLQGLFSKLSEDRVSYNKTEHSVKLTEFIIDNSPNDLKEIEDLLKNILI